mmetsp:Transcript_42642/g.92720  ORF Transcript_42642/g.92720 Transcript_42642/m.92720 type:complete len:299 (-) Transcript_42642:30-926(-)
MASNHRHVDVVGVLPSNLATELVGTHHIQGGNAHDLHRVQTFLLVQLSHSWHDGVDRIHDEPQHGFGAELCACLHKLLGDVRIDLKKIVARHARFAGHTRGDEDQIASRETLLEVLHWFRIDVQHVALHLTLPLQVSQISCHASSRYCGDCEIKDTQLLDIGIQGHEHGQRLSNSTRATADADLEISRRLHLLGLGLGLGFCLDLGLCLCLRLRSCFWLGFFRLCLSFGFGLGRSLLLTLLHLTLLPVSLDGLLFVLASIEGRELFPGVRSTVLGIDSALGHLGQDQEGCKGCETLKN